MHRCVVEVHVQLTLETVVVQSAKTKKIATEQADALHGLPLNGDVLQLILKLRDALDFGF